MILANVLTAMAVGVLAVGTSVSIIQGLVGYANQRANRIAAGEAPSRTSVAANKALDGLTEFVLGPKRLDHEPMYSTVVAALFLVGGFWLLEGPLPQSVIFPFPSLTQITLATCFFVGSGTCLYGISMGTPFHAIKIPVKIFRRVRGRPPLPPLDLRRSYQVGVSGTPPLIVSLGYYAFVLSRDTPLGWTGPNVIMLGFLCMGMTFQWLRFLMENRRINLALPILIQQEINRRVISGDIDLDVEYPARRPIRRRRT